MLDSGSRYEHARGRHRPRLHDAVGGRLRVSAPTDFGLHLPASTMNARRPAQEPADPARRPAFDVSAVLEHYGAIPAPSLPPARPQLTKLCSATRRALELSIMFTARLARQRHRAWKDWRGTATAAAVGGHRRRPAYSREYSQLLQQAQQRAGRRHGADARALFKCRAVLRFRPKPTAGRCVRLTAVSQHSMSLPHHQRRSADPGDRSRGRHVCSG